MGHGVVEPAEPPTPAAASTDGAPCAEPTWWGPGSSYGPVGLRYLNNRFDWNGPTYARHNMLFAAEYNATNGADVVFNVGIDDTRADGYPPYAFLKLFFANGSTVTNASGRLYNRLSAAAGWACVIGVTPMYRNRGRVTRVDLIVSVDYAPQLPDVPLVSIPL